MQPVLNQRLFERWLFNICNLLQVYASASVGTPNSGCRKGLTLLVGGKLGLVTDTF